MIEIYDEKFLMRRSCKIHQSGISEFILNTFVFLRHWHKLSGVDVEWIENLMM